MARPPAPLGALTTTLVTTLHARGVLPSSVARVLGLRAARGLLALADPRTTLEHRRACEALLGSLPRVVLTETLVALAEVQAEVLTYVGEHAQASSEAENRMWGLIAAQNGEELRTQSVALLTALSDPALARSLAAELGVASARDLTTWLTLTMALQVSHLTRQHGVTAALAEIRGR